jgi:hypothetical protein
MTFWSMGVALDMLLDEEYSFRRATDQHPHSSILLCIKFLIYCRLPHRPRFCFVLFTKGISKPICTFETASSFIIPWACSRSRVFSCFWSTNIPKSESRWSKVIFLSLATKRHREFSETRCNIILFDKSLIQLSRRRYSTDGVSGKSSETS